MEQVDPTALKDLLVLELGRRVGAYGRTSTNKGADTELQIQTLTPPMVRNPMPRLGRDNESVFLRKRQDILA